MNTHYNEFIKLIHWTKKNPDETLKFIGYTMNKATESNSQNFQDLWALYENHDKKGGFFIEFGATDGVAGSNTLLLEKKYGWNGVLVEPNPSYEKLLKENRKALSLTEVAIAKTSGETEFIIPSEPDLATMVGYGQNDEHATKRLQGTRRILVKTMTLVELLNLYAPVDIDYVSIDTEGSEYDILEAFFCDTGSKKYNIKCISVEHNFVNDNLQTLLANNGYKLKFPEVSAWDYFFVKDGTNG